MQALKELQYELNDESARIIVLPLESSAPSEEGRSFETAAPLSVDAKETDNNPAAVPLTILRRYIPFLSVALNSVLAVLLILGWHWQQRSQTHAPLIALQPVSQPVGWNNKWMKYDLQLSLNRPPAWISKQLVVTGIWRNYSWRLTRAEPNPTSIKAMTPVAVEPQTQGFSALNAELSTFSPNIEQVALQDVAVAIGSASQWFVWLDMTLSASHKVEPKPLLPRISRQKPWQFAVLDTELSIMPAQQARVRKTPSVLTLTEQASSIYRSALGFYQQGRVMDAEATLWIALGLDSGHIKARTLAVQLMIEQGRLSKAHELLLAGIESAPLHYPYVQSLARILASQSQMQVALQQMEKAQYLAMQDADYLALLAWLYQRNGRHVEAVRVYIDSLALNPEKGQWWLGLAISLQVQQDWQGAIDAYEYALAMGLETGLRQYAMRRHQQLVAM